MTGVLVFTTVYRPCCSLDYCNSLLQCGRNAADHKWKRVIAYITHDDRPNTSSVERSEAAWCGRDERWTAACMVGGPSSVRACVRATEVLLTRKHSPTVLIIGECDWTRYIGHSRLTHTHTHTQREREAYIMADPRDDVSPFTGRQQLLSVKNADKLLQPEAIFWLKVHINVWHDSAPQT